MSCYHISNKNKDNCQDIHPGIEVLQEDFDQKKCKCIYGLKDLKFKTKDEIFKEEIKQGRSKG